MKRMYGIMVWIGIAIPAFIACTIIGAYDGASRLVKLWWNKRPIFNKEAG